MDNISYFQEMFMQSNTCSNAFYPQFNFSNITAYNPTHILQEQKDFSSNSQL